MINVKPWGGDSLRLYDAIRAAKTDAAGRPAILERLRSKIKARYEAYERSKLALEEMRPEPLTGEEEAALVHCYDASTEPLFAMKRDVLRSLPRAINKCPYCGIGEIGSDAGSSVGEWDHYLPRRGSEAFPEFAVYPPNLVPCCATCDRYKGDRWRDVSQRHIINPYFDDIGQRVPLVEAAIDLADEPKATFVFADVPEARTPFGMHFKRHFRRLNLLQRYRWESRSGLVRIQGNVTRRVLRQGAVIVAEVLGEAAENLGASLGVNHWEPTLYRAAARSSEFVSHLLERAGLTSPTMASSAQDVERSKP